MRRQLLAALLLAPAAAFAAKKAPPTDKEIGEYRRLYIEANWKCADEWGNGTVAVNCPPARYYQEALRQVGICAEYDGWATFKDCATGEPR